MCNENWISEGVFFLRVFFFFFFFFFDNERLVVLRSRDKTKCSLLVVACTRKKRCSSVEQMWKVRF